MRQLPAWKLTLDVCLSRRGGIVNMLCTINDKTDPVLISPLGQADKLHPSYKFGVFLSVNFGFGFEEAALAGLTADGCLRDSTSAGVVIIPASGLR